MDPNEDSYVQVEVGIRFGFPAASVMLVALAASPGERAVFPGLVVELPCTMRRRGPSAGLGRH